VADPASLDPRLLLREDMSKEYYAILGVISSYDGWLLVVKGWSVTLSLASLGLGFQQQHFSLFGLAAVTALGFWFLDGLMKGYQFRYYVRMREIEYTSYLVNRVALGGEYGTSEISAPRVDMTWRFKGYISEDEHRRQRWWQRATTRPTKMLDQYEDPRAAEPRRWSHMDIRRSLARRFYWPNVALPHAVAVALGSGLFVAAGFNVPGLELPL
jgi:hypothetical protein